MSQSHRQRSERLIHDHRHAPPRAEEPVSVLLGIDLGDRRIGVAAGDTASGSVTPLLTLRRGSPSQDAQALARICAERRAEAIVVGLPLHMDGSESEQSERTRAWVAAVTAVIDVPVTLRDERLSSQAAQDRMGHAPRGRSGGAPSAAARRAWRARIDREAAAAILQRELDTRVGGGLTS
jgi:putative holliday junction resolvase